MKARLATIALTVACAVYLMVSVQRVFGFLDSGSLLGAGFAIAITSVVAISAGLIIREIRFGFSMNRMAKVLAAEAALLEDSLPKTADGRTVRDAADARFEEIKKEVDEHPDSWRAWFRLATAYDDARDRKRARAAMRTAENLFRT